MRKFVLLVGAAVVLLGGFILARTVRYGSGRPVQPAPGSQWKGNSGVLLMSRYEIQVLESFDNPTSRTARPRRSMASGRPW